MAVGTAIPTPEVAPEAIPEPTLAAPGWTRRRTLIIIGGAILLFVGTYMLAWWSAYSLTLTYLRDADASFEAGNYMDALVGYETFDRAINRYIHHGGYMQVERIWADSYAQPVPDQVAHARERIDLIVNTLLTIEDAEQFVQENIGRSNPYLGMIYLRLGELYEADGRIRDAEDVYESFPDLFPQETALIERARANLERLQAGND